MSTPNPTSQAGQAPPEDNSVVVSKTTIHIAGLPVDIYGLTELAPAANAVSCLWLHHGRGRERESMAPIASLAVSSWNRHRSAAGRGLIAVSCDQRNHGARHITETGNLSWKQGNRTHAQDMFGLVNGMVLDMSLLMDALEGYIFGNGHFSGGTTATDRRRIDQHLVLGVSLGGHVVWQSMFAEPRISAGVVVIGCPDYANLMTDRARKSKLATFSAADDGASFIGSVDFPEALVRSVHKYDPKGILFGSGPVNFPDTSEAEQARLRPILDGRIRGKKFQVLSGGKDKLVPYAKGQPFLDFFKSAVETWYKDGGVSVEDIVYPEAGHEFNVSMMNDAARFIVDIVSSASGKEEVITPAKI